MGNVKDRPQTNGLRARKNQTKLSESPASSLEWLLRHRRTLGSLAKLAALPLAAGDTSPARRHGQIGDQTRLETHQTPRPATADAIASAAADADPQQSEGIANGRQRAHTPSQVRSLQGNARHAARGLLLVQYEK